MSRAPAHKRNSRSAANPNGFDLRCVVVRDGTSRGLFFHERDLPTNRTERDRVIMAAMGAPDPRQVDGLGGADSLLSKVCIVSKSLSSRADIECEFANIAPGSDRPTYGTNCGNLVAGAAIFAIDEELARPATGRRAVRIFNKNSGALISARISGMNTDEPDFFSNAGMTSTGTRVHLDFHDPVGTFQENLLPTGNEYDDIRLPDGTSVRVSIIDAGAMYVFVKAEDLGLTGVESKEQMDQMHEKLGQLEYIRGSAAKLVGIVDSVENAVNLSPDVPKLAFVGPAAQQPINGVSPIVDARSVDLVSRIISSQKFHNAYAVTAAIATAAAASVAGSTVHEVSGRDLNSGIETIRIGHPTGIMECTIAIEDAPMGRTILSAGVARTARRIMEGTVFIPGPQLSVASDYKSRVAD
jgi:2-methylaconitate cis-trans-isomerase PrpF